MIPFAEIFGVKPVFITASTLQELSLIVRLSGARQRSGVGPVEIYEGQLGDWQVIIAVTGMGKVNAASAITALLERKTPQLLINTGCAGAYAGSGLVVGDLAVATAEVFADEGVLTLTGWQPLDFIGIPLLLSNGTPFFNEFPLSLSAAAKAMNLASHLALPMHRGRFVTVSTCSGTAARGEELFRLFGGICENMEGAAVAHVALLYGVDAMEVRGISNMVEDRDLSRWDIPLAAEMAQRFLLKYLENY